MVLPIWHCITIREIFLNPDPDFFAIRTNIRSTILGRPVAAANFVFPRSA